MFGFRVAMGAAFVAVVSFGYALAAEPTTTLTAQQQQTDAAAKKAAADKAAADKAAAEKAAAEKDAAARLQATLFQGSFRAEILAGGTANDFRVSQPSNRIGDVKATLKWKPTGYEDNKVICPEGLATSEVTLALASRAPERGTPTNTTLGIIIPSPPCLWPPRQNADITVSAPIEGVAGEKPLFKGTLPVSMFWLPFVVTFIVLALIYPGGAAASWYVSLKQYKKKVAAAKPGDIIGAAPKFWASLDPVELTKNPYGRGSIAKLQIFTFSFIVFGLLLFNVLRTGLLVNMSKDVLYLMGISAFGAAGGKIAYVARRRLSLENWAWLRSKQWLPPGDDVAPHAKWSELFIDSGTKEFDPYRFQMAIFSLVVAIALITTSATGLEAFTIPPEMLGLLGISQVVFIGGQAMENGGFDELDKKLTELRQIEKNYYELETKADTARTRAKAAAAADTTPPKTPEEEAAEVERKKFNDAVTQAAAMYTGVYGDQVDPVYVAGKVAATRV